MRSLKISNQRETQTNLPNLTAQSSNEHGLIAEMTSKKHSNPFHLLEILSLVRWYSTKFNASTNSVRCYPKSLTPCTFTLCKGELFRISSTFQEVNVLSGVAWITVAGKDIILQPGEKSSIASNKDITLVSALGDAPLVLTVC